MTYKKVPHKNQKKEPTTEVRMLRKKGQSSTRTEMETLKVNFPVGHGWGGSDQKEPKEAIKDPTP